jgi:hypothetical protein
VLAQHYLDSIRTGRGDRDRERSRIIMGAWAEASAVLWAETACEA